MTTNQAIALGTAVWTLLACGGGDQPAGQIRGEPRAPASLEARRRAQLEAAPERAEEKQILFGDLHVHTTYSLDAFLFSLPILGGEGAHPPADACDFARHCAALDFFSITDHARSLTPEHWAAEKQAVRQCNAVANDPANPDLVVFHGWEWTQIGLTPETHFGHKNLIFLGLEDDEVPARPISSLGGATHNDIYLRAREATRGRFVDPLHWRAYADLAWFLDRLDAVPSCAPGIDTRELPPDCHESAPTPDLLFEKLAQWGFDALVIPHGTTWGSYTPPGSAWDKQLTSRMHDPERQTLIEVASGHGNSEAYRSFREYEIGADGAKICPPPSANYLPCCWRAGEIMRARCGDLPAAECEARVARARRLVLEAGTAPDRVFPGTRADDWLDCGQCRDCFKPAYGYRPCGSAQYALALSRFGGKQGGPLRFRFGFIASSDSHTGRGATGYKQGIKRGMSDMFGSRSAFYGDLVSGARQPDDPQRPEPVPRGAGSPLTTERISSFFYPGGLVAVHAVGRDRTSIWEALEQREVYGTSGPRILLWFDLLDSPEGRLPMGRETNLAGTPRFEVRAVGAFVQQPGCPEDSVRALSPEGVEQLCLGECYHPGDLRHAITAIEVIRIRPQIGPREPLDPLIQDPWLRFDCPPDPAGCRVEFQDPEFVRSGRDAIYYVRALQEPTPALNAANLRTEFDADGRPIEVQPCFADYREEPGDDCLVDAQERAWSSPIFVNQPPKERASRR
jgi:hypothetical protein